MCLRPILLRCRLALLPLTLLGAVPGHSQVALELAAPAATLVEARKLDALLPDAPSAAQDPEEPAAQQELHLPRHYTPAWAVDRSHLGEKLRYGAGSLVSVRPLLEALVISGLPDITSPPRQPVFMPGENPLVYQSLMDVYGDATNAWLRQTDTNLRAHGYRLEVGLATAETRQLLSNLVLPIALHQGARYRPAAIDATLGERLRSAAESLVLTEDDHGRTVANYSKLGGTVAAGFLGSMVYAPKIGGTSLHSGRFALKYISYSLAGDLATNTTHELLRAAVAPDMQMYRMHGHATEDSYYPRSIGGKVLDWAHSSYGLRTFVSAALLAGLPSIHDEPTEPRFNDPSTYNGYPDYNTAYDAWGTAELQWKDGLEENVRVHARRLAGGLAETETQVALQKLILPIALEIDPRYVSLGPEHAGSERMAHTFTSLLTARSDAGGHTINLPLLVGTAGAALLAKEIYYPALNTPALETNSVLATTIALNLIADVLGNLKHEFLRGKGY